MKHNIPDLHSVPHGLHQGSFRFNSRYTFLKLWSYKFCTPLLQFYTSVCPSPWPGSPTSMPPHQKPDIQAAYQAFCQPACVIILSKHPTALWLPPPPHKLPGAGTHCPPPLHHFPPPLSVCLLGFPFPSSIYRCLVFAAWLNSLLYSWVHHAMLQDFYQFKENEKKHL